MHSASQPEPPATIRIAATIFTVFAWIAVAEVILALLQRRLSFNFSLLGFLIAPALLRGERGWRTVALVLSAISVIATVAMLGMMLLGKEVTAKFMGTALPEHLAWMPLMLLVPSCVIDAWLCWSLTNSAAQSWFERDPEPHPPSLQSI